MATIQIKDLNESRDMDREAMRAVTGGSSAGNFRQIFRDNSVLYKSTSSLDAFRMSGFNFNPPSDL